MTKDAVREMLYDFLNSLNKDCGLHQLQIDKLKLEANEYALGHLENMESSSRVIESALNAIQDVEYNASSEGCGLEDQGITDRYEAMEYGYQNGLDAAYEAVKQLRILITK